MVSWLIGALVKGALPRSCFSSEHEDRVPTAATRVAPARGYAYWGYG